jgi:hypothetical protein
MFFFNRTIILLLSGYLFLGVSHIAFLPPWEGFDETAHFSYIQQIADTGSLPKQRIAKLSEDVEEYKFYAPMPYSGIPPFEDNTGFTYKKFFKSTPQTIRKGRSYLHLPPEKPRRYAQGTTYNWQAQHPPLYYALLSPIYIATRSFPFADQIFILRCISYLFACSALLITACAGFLFSNPKLNFDNTELKHLLSIGVLSIPIFFPTWFPAMARIGNDSLCALLLSVLWILCLRVFFINNSIKVSVLIGLFMGLGCLTKAFFLPLSAGIIFSLSLQQFTKKDLLNKITVLKILLIPMIMFITSGWWYLGNWLEGSALLGSDEMNILKESGGIIKGLKQYFSVKAWLRGHAAIIASLGWSSTWSWARPPYLYIAPLAIAVAFITISYLWVLRSHKITAFAWLPFWSALPVIMGFSYHVLIRIALTGEGRGTGGYYLLFMVPVIGSTIGLGLLNFWHKKKFRFFVALLGLYAVSFSIVITWAQILLFSGIIFKSGNNKFYQFPYHFPPYFGIPNALTNLSAIAYPKLGTFCLITGAVPFIIGLILLWRLIGKIANIRANQTL